MSSNRVLILLFFAGCLFISGSYGLICLTCGPKDGQSPCNATIRSEPCKNTFPAKDGEDFACILMVGEDQDLQERSEARFCLPLKIAVDNFHFIQNGTKFVPKVGNCYSDLRVPHEFNPNITFPLYNFCMCTSDNCNSLVALAKSSQVKRA